MFLCAYSENIAPRRVGYTWKIQRNFLFHFLMMQSAGNRGSAWETHVCERSSLQLQDYFLYLRPSDARLYFSLRCGTFDLKTLRKYSYEDGDVMCRLCSVEEETVEHIVNRCDLISRDDHVENIFSELKEDVVKVVARMKEFNCLADEMSDDDCS